MVSGELDHEWGAARARTDDQQVDVRLSGGGFGSEEPTAHDAFLLSQAETMTAGGDLIGNTEASRNLAHYLGGTGTTLPLDIDRAMSDDSSFRSAVASDDVSGNVSVVPDAHGQPKITMDYQANVWDRYDWDAGKETPIGPVTIKDADTARLHTVGLAQEFDTHGTSSSRQRDLGSAGTPDVSAGDPGRGEEENR
ncbi:hypothetical protein ACFYRL_27465 [Streptomyces goshikiensis]|uniref:hypothetical protein n=1 Tax=Streptomyces goshikiensis TaxID=1942 RepID=UPI0036A6A060